MTTTSIKLALICIVCMVQVYGDEPGKPEEPLEPGKPEEPSEPGKPGEPEEPSEPGKPGEPEEPPKPERANTKDINIIFRAQILKDNNPMTPEAAEADQDNFGMYVR